MNELSAETLALRLSLDLRDGSSFLTVVTGPMCSGKTEVLVSLARSLRAEKCAAFRHKLDTQRTPDWKSRSGKRAMADTYIGSTLENLLSTEKILLLDEAHFLENGPYFGFFLQQRRDNRLPTVVAGLNMDYCGVGFDPMAQALVLADQVFVLAAKCQKCQKPASYTFRKTDGPARIAVGFDLYEPRCLDCWLAGRNKQKKEQPHAGSTGP